jgi:beta-phosphoglucomutase
MDSLEIILSLGEVSLDQEQKVAMAAKKNGWYLDYIQSVTTEDALPNVVSFISDLKRHAIRLAVGSSSKNARPIIAQLGVKEMFDVIVDGNDLTNSKPHPEVFLKAAAQLGIAPEHCVVFEDAQSGVQAAKSAGMRCVGIGSIDLLGAADVVIPSLVDFSADTLLTIFSAIPKT